MLESDEQQGQKNKPGRNRTQPISQSRVFRFASLERACPSYALVDNLSTCPKRMVLVNCIAGQRELETASLCLQPDALRDPSAKRCAAPA